MSTGIANVISISNDSIVRVIRIKSTNGVPPIIVEMKDSSVRNEFIRKSHRKFNDVYVNPDLTEAQRNLDKQLREKCHNLNASLNLKANWNNVKEYWVIRNNDVIKINK